MKRHDNRAWFLVMPAGAIMLFVGLVPLVTVFNYSFLDIFTLQDTFWIGPDWYREILQAERFHHSFVRSLLFSAIVLSIQFPLGVAIALLLAKTGRLAIGIIMVLAVPLVVPWNIIGMLWLDLVSPRTGIVGQFFATLGFAVDYKFNALHTWLILIVMDTWHWLGLIVILAYSGLSSIPPEYYRATAIDGASRLAVFRYIELPKISGALSIALLLRFIDSFMIYTEAFAINAGGPHAATTFLSIDLGEDVKSFNYGSAAARSMIYFLIVITVVWVFKTVMDVRKSTAPEMAS